MSNEIVPYSSAMRGCKHHSSIHLEDIPQFQLLRFGRIPNTDLEFNLMSDNHHMTHFFPPDKGHRYVKLSNPTRYSVKSILEEMKGPSMLCLRGCDHFLLQSDFPFEKFKTLTALEISSIDNLTVIPKEISEMTQLQTLNLSHLPIQHFPADDFLSKLTNLRSLVIKGCSNLHSLPKFPTLTALVSLELSHLLIEALPDGFFSDMKGLHRLILKGCYKLHSLPSMEGLKGLQFLDLSNTTLHCMIDSVSAYPNLIHVLCRDANGSAFDSLIGARKLQVLDLSGAQHLRPNLQIKGDFLEALNLSRTSIESIDFASRPRSLSILLLRNCSGVVQLPEMKRLPFLKVLDISGCKSLCVLPEDLCELKYLEELNLSGCSNLREMRKDVFDQMWCLGKLNLSKTNLKNLPSFSNLIVLRTHLILPRNLVDKVSVLSSNIENRNLLNLEIVEDNASLDHESDDEIEGSWELCIQSKPNEFHLVSTFTSTDSAFYLFKHEFSTHLKKLISEFQGNIEANSSDKSRVVFKRYYGRILADLEYILDNIDLLESFDYKGNARMILEHLIDVVGHHRAHKFPLDSRNSKELIRLVVKLKLLFPRPKQEDSDSKKKKYAEQYVDVDQICKHSTLDQYFIAVYDSLTKAQRNCLLVFAAFALNPGQLMVKSRTLIDLWCGEGFIDDARHEQNADPSSYAYPYTVEETGRQILMVLQGKGFIYRREYSKDCFMNISKHSFVRGRAKAEGLLDLYEDCKLTPYLTNGIERACLLKSQYNFKSSCELWANYANTSHEKIECFEKIRTLFNVDEGILDLRADWFSKMKNLYVLHLGNWNYENKKPIEVVDLNFLEGLKNMKQLRLLNFEGIPGIRKLPEYICKLTSLRIINLRHCIYLEELPTSIGSLTNLVHLDVTQCPLLSMLPKGIKLLSKLEVLKGFLITYKADGLQNKKACTLEDLIKLENLRQLNLVVNIDTFPNTEDLHVFKQLKNLCNLKITWMSVNYIDQETLDVLRVGHQSSKKHSRWEHLKCWKPRTCQNDVTGDAYMRSNRAFLANLKKLVLCCFPSEIAPKWLHPSELHNLEELCILGGQLKKLPGDPNQDTWNVKALRLFHTLKLDVDWETLSQIFPNMLFLKKLPNDHLSTFPVDKHGEWFQPGSLPLRVCW